MKLMKTVPALLLCLCLLLSMAACAKPEQTSGGKSLLSTEPLEPAHAATSYDEVKEYLLRQQESYMLLTDYTEVSLETSASFDEAAGESTVSEEYSNTNVQVDGVDEADIVKTDGTYIYALFGNALKILRADGAESAVVCDYYLDLNTEENSDSYPEELYLSGTNLYIIVQKNDWGSEENGWTWNETTLVQVYDVSDPSAPKLQTTLGQDGTYNTSRLTDGILYLISVQNCVDLETEGNDWVPVTYCDGEENILTADSIYICPSSYESYMTVVGSYDCNANALTDVCSFTGSADCIYMNSDAVYIAQTAYEERTSEPYTEKQYTVTDHESVCTTQIHRIRTQDGKLTLDGSGTVDGYLLNQFAMDVYDGMLRVATTVSSNSYSVYWDETYDFENYLYGEDTSGNNLTVLDADMNKLGEVTDLASGEYIYSVRYFGTTAFVVTYESIDPVFTIDLTDPTAPKVQGALELSGVSDYLQGFGDGLLFGFGRALDENAASNGLQLNMFDITDGSDVKLLDKAVIADEYSEAIYNHKAILVSAEKNLIAFPGTDNGFYIYAFENGAFVQKGYFPFDTQETYWNWGTSRGVYVGDCLYLISEGDIYVVSMIDFEAVAHLGFAEG